jgi:C4-dicarboxylate-binding protein DctP
MTVASGLRYVVAAVLVSMPPAACSGGSGDKAGGDAEPVVLRMATIEGRGAPYADAVEEFARQVRDLSGGDLRLRVVWEGASEYLGGFGPGADQKIARLVQKGTLDMALIPARAWDELGVTSLQALQAPFLVSSEDLVDRVVQSELAGEMLAGLEQAGVVGLVLVPEGLRHPVGFARPLLAVDDFAGATIRALPSNASNRLLRALGATPVDICCKDFSTAVARGEIAGAESGFAWGGDLPRPGTFTANVTFYPKVNVVVANDDVFAELSDEHRDILRRAAAGALRHVVSDGPREAERAAVYCRNGGKIASASERDLAALERAARPVYAALEADAQTRKLIARIRVLKAQAAASSETVAFCTASSNVAAPRASAPERTEFPEGVYRVNLKAEDLIAKGMDARTAYEIEGLSTTTFEDGHWRGTFRQRGVDLPPCWGRYSVRAGRITLLDDSEQCGEPRGTLVMTARWKLSGRMLRFFDIRKGRPLEWGGTPWTKID